MTSLCLAAVFSQGVGTQFDTGLLSHAKRQETGSVERHQPRTGLSGRRTAAGACARDVTVAQNVLGISMVVS